LKRMLGEWRVVQTFEHSRGETRKKTSAQKP